MLQPAGQNVDAGVGASAACGRTTGRWRAQRIYTVPAGKRLIIQTETAQTDCAGGVNPLLSLLAVEAQRRRAFLRDGAADRSPRWDRQDESFEGSIAAPMFAEAGEIVETRVWLNTDVPPGGGVSARDRFLGVSRRLALSLTLPAQCAVTAGQLDRDAIRWWPIFVSMALLGGRPWYLPFASICWSQGWRCLWPVAVGRRLRMGDFRTVIPPMRLVARALPAGRAIGGAGGMLGACGFGMLNCGAGTWCDFPGDACGFGDADSSL